MFNFALTFSLFSISFEFSIPEIYIFIYFLGLSTLASYFHWITVLPCSCYLQIGQYITSNGGVVAAEELAPYLDIDSTKELKVTSFF